MTSINPIKTKIKKLIESGLSPEKICVAADITYWAFRQKLYRETVSKQTKLCLLVGKLIDESDVEEYEEWAAANKRGQTKRKKRNKKSKRNVRKKEKL